jgi:nucleotide-binding universal stress UspA family protein
VVRVPADRGGGARQLLASAVGLFGIGAEITRVTGPSAWRSGLRQLSIGLAAAAVTYAIGLPARRICERRMTSLLIAYDGSAPAADAIRSAAALFPGADALVLTVRREPLTPQMADAARIRIPDASIAGATMAFERAVDADAESTASDGVRVAMGAGLTATSRVVTGPSNPWREVRDAAAAIGADVVVSGARGLGAGARLALGSTSSGLLHHADRTLLIVPRVEGPADGALVIGFDGSPAAREAIVVAGRLLAGRQATVVTVWESLIRHSLSGRALSLLPVEEVRGLTRDFDEYYRAVAADIAADGAALAAEGRLRATAAEAETGGSPSQALLDKARSSGAAAIVVGARGRGSVSSALLGSVSSGLVHNADRPVLVARPVAP